MIYCVCRTHTHTHTHTQMRAHTCTRHLATFTFAAFAPFGDTIGRHLTTIASGFRRICLPGTRSGTPAYRTHTGLTREWVSIFRPFGLLTRVHNLLRLPDTPGTPAYGTCVIYCVCRTHTHTHTRPRGRTPVRDTWPHLRLPHLHHHHWATPDHYCEWL